MTTADLRAPFPYFGGKRRAASRIWEAFGDPGGYVEPFAGSAAVLLARPPVSGRRVETLNDIDGWLVNTWRAIRDQPLMVAEYASGPSTEIDYHARLAWLQERRDADLVSWLEGDPEASDAKAAGWWLYVMGCGIGDPFGPGPWRTVDSRLVDVRALPERPDGDGVNRELQHLGTGGMGIHRAINHLGDTGRGVHRPAVRGLAGYMLGLADRLRHVRITCGSWERVVTPSASRATSGKPGVAILMDPPYSTSGDLYAATNRRGSTDHETLADRVREWCLSSGAGYRIALCGFEEDHDETLSHGWFRDTGKAGGSGYTVDAMANRRERIWFSPECYSDALFDLHSFGEQEIDTTREASVKRIREAKQEIRREAAP